MNNIPTCCPSCGAEKTWKEVINPFTTGIPIGKSFRIRLNIIKSPLLNRAALNEVKYHCGNCDFEGVYNLK